MAKQFKIKLFIFSINDIDYIIKKYIDSDIKIAIKKSLVNLFSKLSSDFHFYADILLILESNKLLPH